MSEILLSGLLGALFATLLSALYHYASEKSKLRSEVLLEIVGYIDDIYHHIQEIHAVKNKEYRENVQVLTPELYDQINRELSILLKSNKHHAKLRIVYGESEALRKLNGLTEYLMEATSILRKATRSAWVVNENKAVETLFKDKIDPLNASLIDDLIKGSSMCAVIMCLFLSPIKCNAKINAT